MATYLDEYRNRKLSFAPLLQAGKMTLRDTVVYQELLYRIQVLETCKMLCKAAPVTTDTRELVGHYQLVDAVLFCAEKEHAFGVPVQEKGKAQRKAAGENLAKIVTDCRKRFSSFQAKTPEQYRQSISAMVGPVLVAWVQLRNTYVPIGEEAKQK